MATASKTTATLVSDWSAEMAYFVSRTEELTRSSRKVIEQTNAILLDSRLLLCAVRNRDNP